MLIGIIHSYGKSPLTKYLVQEQGFECRTSPPRTTPSQHDRMVIDPVRPMNWKQTIAFARCIARLGGIVVRVDSAPDVIPVPVVHLPNPWGRLKVLQRATDQLILELM